MYLPVLQYGSDSAGQAETSTASTVRDRQQRSGGSAVAGLQPTISPEVEMPDVEPAARARPGTRPQAPPSLTEERSQAVYATMERLLETSAETEEQLLASVQHLSGEEYLQVAEERALAGMCGRGACSNALDAAKPKGTFKIDAARQRVYKDGDISFCSSACDLQAQRLAARLGTVDSALQRFAAALPPPEPVASRHKQQPVYAAGAEGNPVMLSEIKEVDPSVLRAKQDAQAATAQLTAAALSASMNPNAVEGYIPRSSRQATRSSASSAAARREGPGSGAGAERASNGLAEKAQSRADSRAALPAERDTVTAKEEGMEQSATEPMPAPSQPQQPVLVFEVDDPRSPLEAAEGADAGGIATRFGELRVKDAADLGLGAQELQQLGSQQAAEAPSQPAGIQADLQLWRDHLASQGLDPATAGDSLLVSAAEGNDGGPAEDEGAPENALDSSAYLEDAPGGPQLLSRFGAMFTLINGMVTEASLAYLQSGGGQPPAPTRPEVRRAALEGAIARVLPCVLADMRVAALRSAVELHLRALISTFHLDSALPSLKDHEWQLLTLALLKALSLQRLPALQPNFEGRVGVQGINMYLRRLDFSLEEFEALLEALLPAD